MRRGIMSMGIVLLMLLLPVLAVGEEYSSNALHMRFEIPQGMTVTEEGDDEMGVFRVTVTRDEPPAFSYAVTIVVTEDLYGKTLKDIEEDDTLIAKVLEYLGMINDGFFYQVRIVETDDYPYLEVSEAEGRQIHIIDLYEGEVFSMSAISGEEPLTEEQYASFEAFCASLIFEFDRNQYVTLD